MSWKTPAEGEWKRACQDMWQALMTKMHRGQQRYGLTWQGTDPLDHAVEEVLDLHWYLWWAKRRVAELEAENAELRERLGEVPRSL